jgi:hypothetical protein
MDPGRRADSKSGRIIWGIIIMERRFHEGSIPLRLGGALGRLTSLKSPGTHGWESLDGETVRRCKFLVDSTKQKDDGFAPRQSLQKALMAPLCKRTRGDVNRSLYHLACPGKGLPHPMSSFTYWTNSLYNRMRYTHHNAVHKGSSPISQRPDSATTSFGYKP